MEESVKQTVLLIVQALLLSVLVASVAFAGGYQINEMGARATGMGGAFVATASDPSAIYYNPAGLASQKGINALVGLDLIIPSTDYTPTVGTKVSTESQVFLPLNLYGTYQLDDQTVVGLGVFNPFGLGSKWPAALGSLDASLQTWYFNPSVGYKIDDDLSVGLGASYVYVKISENMKLPATTSFVGTGNGFNLNLGAMYKPMDGLSIGLSYRIPTDVKVSGDFFAGNATLTGEATIPLPGNLQVGASYQVMPELTVEGDVQYVQWSRYKGITVTRIDKLTYAENAKWDDAAILRAGAEYKLNEEISLRAGVILDLSPQPPSQTTLVLPDSYRQDVSIGGSYKIDENLSIHAAYMLVLFGERDAKTATPPGKYSTMAHILDVNVAYAF